MKISTDFLKTICLVIIVSSCIEKPNLSATIEGLNSNDTIYIDYAPVSTIHEIDEPLRDTIYSKENSFQFNNPLDEPILAYFFPEKGAFKRADGSPYRPTEKHIFLLVRPEDKVTVSGSLNKFYLAYSATGSQFNEEYSKLRDKYVTRTAEAVKIELEIDSSYAAKVDFQSINALFKKRNEIFEIRRKSQVQYIKENLKSDLSAYLLGRQKLDTLGKYYDNLDEEIKNGLFKNALEKQFNQYQKFVKAREAEINIVEGKPAPDFSLKSTDGTDVKLSSINKKYTIIDFWGSWCQPCLAGFPTMKSYYSKYKDQIEILGIACNDSETKWKKAIEEHQLDWEHVINNDELSKDVSVMYGIQSYPTKIILDQNHIIIAKFVGEGEDFYQKLDELLTN
ncbi:TlpA family protein disulfide reductase [Ekhidna sp.]|uniref:TlpA family protein disulfide reductase n=1 Tax=Ekhidna sp. TaxID=2608089 RepID=UPI003B5089D9